MPVPHQKFIVIGLWCLATADAARQGLALPQSAFVTLSSENHQFNPAIALFGLLCPPVCVLGTAYFKSSKASQPVKGRISRWVDDRWGAGSANGFLRSLRPSALVGFGAFVLGGTGLTASIYSKANSFALETASFFIAAGVGFGIARLIALRLTPNEPWI